MAMRSRPVFGRIAVVAACAALLFGAAYGPTVEAGKPAPPPPPPPSAGPEVYQWRPDLGGMLDTSTNLVWGCQYAALSGGTAPYTYVQGLAYPAMMLDLAAEYYDDADFYYGIGDDAMGDHYFAAGVACEDAASFTNWRIPTKSEASDAIAKKLFKYDIPGWSGYWSTPLGPDILYGGGWYAWTSTSGKVARGGFKTRWVYLPSSDTGNFGELPEGSSNDVIWVRTHTP